MSIVITLTVPLSALNANVEASYTYAYLCPEIIMPREEHMALEFEVEVPEDFGPYDEDTDFQTVKPLYGTWKAKKPRLVIA